MTTWIKRAESMRSEALPQCHGGEGTLDWTQVVEECEVPRGSLRFIHDDVLPPGASVGEHKHTDDVEYYVVLAGRGVMVLEGEEHRVETGDVTAVFPGGSHGLRNDSAQPLRVLVFCIRASDRNGTEDRQARTPMRCAGEGTGCDPPARVSRRSSTPD